MFLRWKDAGLIKNPSMARFCDGLVGLDLFINCSGWKNAHAAWLMAAGMSTSNSCSCDSQSHSSSCDLCDSAIQIQTQWQTVPFLVATSWIAKWGSRFHLAANHAEIGFSIIWNQVTKFLLTLKASKRSCLGRLHPRTCRISFSTFQHALLQNLVTWKHWGVNFWHEDSWDGKDWKKSESMELRKSESISH